MATAIDFAKASPAELQAAGYSFIKLAPAGPSQLEAIHGLPKGSLLWCDGMLSADQIPAQSAEFLEEMELQESPALQGLINAIEQGEHQYGFLPEIDAWDELGAQAAAEQDWSNELLLDEMSQEELFA